MIKIQQVKKIDFKDIVKLWNQEYRQLTSSKMKISIKKFGRWYDSREKTGYEYFSCKYKGNFAGFLFIQKEKKRSLILIKAIAIKKKYKKFGLGKCLLKKSIKITKKLGFSLRTEVLINDIDTINWFFANNFFIVKFNKKTNDCLMEYIK